MNCSDTEWSRHQPHPSRLRLPRRHLARRPRRPAHLWLRHRRRFVLRAALEDRIRVRESRAVAHPATPGGDVAVCAGPTDRDARPFGTARSRPRPRHRPPGTRVARLGCVGRSAGASSCGGRSLVFRRATSSPRLKTRPQHDFALDDDSSSGRRNSSCCGHRRRGKPRCRDCNHHGSHRVGSRRCGRRVHLVLINPDAEHSPVLAAAGIFMTVGGEHRHPSRLRFMLSRRQARMRLDLMGMLLGVGCVVGLSGSTMFPARLAGFGARPVGFRRHEVRHLLSVVRQRVAVKTADLFAFSGPSSCEFSVNQEPCRRWL